MLGVNVQEYLSKNIFYILIYANLFKYFLLMKSFYVTFFEKFHLLIKLKF